MSHFGTDGIRGKATVFSNQYLRKIALAALSVKRNAFVLIGRDTRESGLEIEKRLSEAFLDYGGRVCLVGIVPTPTLAMLTKKLGADFGIMLSASHNPPEYNGVKFFSSTGEKVSDEVERQIEEYIDSPMASIGIRKHEAEYFYGDEEYINFLIEKVSPEIRGLRVLLDCANGAAASIAPKLFTMLGAEVFAMNTETDGRNINVNCGATHPEVLLEEMKKGGYDIGFTYDGDSDRVMAVCNGKIYNGDQLLYAHARHMKEKGTLSKNTLVCTVMSNMGYENACKEHGITFLRTAVGDKYVHRELKENGYNIGGEESGHLIFFDYMSTGDGILASLLTAMLLKEFDIEKVLSEVRTYPSVSDSYYCDKEKASRFFSDEMLQSYLRELRFDGRAVVRPSGTEPKIRIMVEATATAEAEKYTKEIKDMIMRRLG